MDQVFRERGEFKKTWDLLQYFIGYGSMWKSPWNGSSYLR